MELQPLQKVSYTPYEISTITVTGNVNSHLNLDAFYEFIDIDKYDMIRYVEYGSTKSDHCYKGVRESKTKKTKPFGKRFDNQMTLHVVDGEAKYNVKLFKNGKLQMTGVKDVDFAKDVVDELIKIITIENKQQRIILNDCGELENCNFKTQLINCYFRINYKVNRAELYRLLSNKYSLNCTYEPCIYQGVKLTYYFNGNSENGKCNCLKRCLGKGPKTICKKVTVATFQSGCVMISGATEIAQIDHLYAFMKNLLEKHAETIHQPQYELK